MKFEVKALFINITAGGLGQTKHIKSISVILNTSCLPPDWRSTVSLLMYLF